MNILSRNSNQTARIPDFSIVRAYKYFIFIIMQFYLVFLHLTIQLFERSSHFDTRLNKTNCNTVYAQVNTLTRSNIEHVDIIGIHFRESPGITFCLLNFAKTVLGSVFYNYV